MRFLIFLSVCATQLAAETPLNGQAFDALVTGKTLTFSAGQAPYGVEYYAPNQRVIWSFVNGDCVNGVWYEKPSDTGPQICFEYENNDVPQCWQIFEDEVGLRAQFMTRDGDAPAPTVLYQAKESEPLICAGVGT